MTVFLSCLFFFFFFGDHNGNKFYNFLCYPRLFRQYVQVIFIIIIYIFVCSYYVLIIRTVRFCQINQIKKKKCSMVVSSYHVVDDLLNFSKVKR